MESLVDIVLSHEVNEPKRKSRPGGCAGVSETE